MLKQLFFTTLLLDSNSVNERGLTVLCLPIFSSQRITSIFLLPKEYYASSITRLLFSFFIAFNNLNRKKKVVELAKVCLISRIAFVCIYS